MKPILFNTDMVQGILVGRKTQTRRVVKPQPEKVIYESNGEVVLIDDGRKAAPPRPYHEGDILYVREARLFLKVTKVRGERLQNIPEADADAEGFANDGDESAIIGFSRVWDDIYEKRGYGWDANPFVWVIEFERTEASND